MNRKDAGFALVNQQTVLLLAEPQVGNRQRVPQIPLGLMIQLIEGAYARVCRMVPAGLPAPDPPNGLDRAWDEYVRPAWPRAARAVRRYCATKAFGGWSAYQSKGMRTLIAEMLVSEQVLRVEAARACQNAKRPLDRELLIDAIRAADRLLVHLVDRDALVDWLGAVER